MSTHLNMLQMPSKYFTGRSCRQTNTVKAGSEENKLDNTSFEVTATTFATSSSCDLDEGMETVQ